MGFRKINLAELEIWNRKNGRNDCSSCSNKGKGADVGQCEWEISDSKEDVKRSYFGFGK